jgi:hypothetical protein
MTVSTAYGRGADAQVNEDRDDSNVVSSTGFGTSATLNSRFTTNQRNEYSIMRFDLAKVKSGSITDAALELTAYRNMTSGEKLNVYGLIQDSARWNWDEQSIDFANAPALAYDANPTTRGLQTDQVYNLGQFTLTGQAEGSTVSFNNANLSVFLNLSAYYEKTAWDGVVTLLLERSDGGGGQSRFASKEATSLESAAAGTFPAGTFAPRLQLSAIQVAPQLAGDYNGDGAVDTADYIVWRRNYVTAVALPNEDETPGYVTSEDYAVWRSNFGRTLASIGAGSSLGMGEATIPEPSTFAMLAIGFPCIFSRKRFSR